MTQITNLGTFEAPLTEFAYTLYADDATNYTIADGAEVYVSTSLSGNGIHISIPTATYESDATIPWRPDRVVLSVSLTPSNLACTVDHNPGGGLKYVLSSTSNTLDPGTIGIQLKFQIHIAGSIYTTLSTRSFTINLIPVNTGSEGDVWSSPAATRDEIVPQEQQMQDEMILMSDPSDTMDYLIYSNKTPYNCIESYKWISGSEQPFEYVVLDISKKQLSVLAPDLMDRIIAGKNVVTIIGPGQGTYIVTSCKKNSSTWRVTAYSNAERIKAIKTTRSINMSHDVATPSHILFELASEGFSTISSSSPVRPIQAIVYLYRASNDTWEIEPTGYSKTPMIVPAGTSIWYLMSVCALKLGCKLWVANSNLYVVDPSISFNDTSSEIIRSDGLQAVELDTIYLNREGYFPLETTPAQEILLKNITNLPSPGKEGIEVLRNKIFIEIDADKDYRSADSITGLIAQGQPGEGTKRGIIESDPVMTDASPVYPTLVSGSINYFKEIAFSYQLPQLGYANAKKIANLTAETFCDAETSISFEVREMTEESSVDTEGRTSYIRRWVPIFNQLTRIHNIIDYSNDLHISTKCNFGTGSTILHAKGLLSKVERTFPEHIARYTFGISTPTDLSQSTSIIYNSINNK